MQAWPYGVGWAVCTAPIVCTFPPDAATAGAGCIQSRHRASHADLAVPWRMTSPASASAWDMAKSVADEATGQDPLPSPRASMLPAGRAAVVSPDSLRWRGSPSAATSFSVRFRPPPACGRLRAASGLDAAEAGTARGCLRPGRLGQAAAVEAPALQRCPGRGRHLGSPWSTWAA